MDTIIFLAIMVGALMHAGWNAVIKIGLDRFSAILLLSLFQGAISFALIPFFPSIASDAWPWLFASILLHVGYKFFLIKAYALGGLSQIYPLARGTAPLIVSVISTLYLGEILSLTNALGIVSIGLGIMAMAISKGPNTPPLSRKALAFAFCTASFTAAYTLVDGIGARLSFNASSFTLWLFAGDSLIMLLSALFLRGRGAITKTFPEWKSGLVAGALSLGSYWIAIWAMTKAPIALVSGLRESSVLFAMFIAVFLLKEKAGIIRWLAAFSIGTGILLTRF